jgi:hypothetical protein
MAANSPVAFAGIDGNVTMNGVTYSVREWKMSIDGDAIKVTSTADGGWRTQIIGPVGGEGTFKINADCEEFPLETLAPVATTCIVTPVAATFELGSSGQTITCTVRVQKADINNPAEEEVTIEYSFVTTGPISFYGT